MSADAEIAQLLGRLDGKLDQVISSFDRHIDDDVRRFTEIHKKLDEQAEDINKAKGAKGAVLWLVGGGAAAIASTVVMAAKALGLK